MARIESGRVLMETRPVAAGELVAGAVEPLRGAFAEHGVALEVDVPQALGARRVMADVTRVGHVFANLLNNALKYTSPGGRVRVAASEVGGGRVEFTVADDGAGIPRQYVGRVFEKFFRAPGQPGDSGTGLGLAIVKDIIEAHGGAVSVESEVGRGTTFRFTLPAAPGAAAEPEAAGPRGMELGHDEAEDVADDGRGLPLAVGAAQPEGGARG
jgi:signal transduction histidine kinase